MKIQALINRNRVSLDLKGTDKTSVIDELASIMEKDGAVDDIEAFIEAINEREKEDTTGVGRGVAIPHAKSRSVQKPALVFGRTGRPIRYESHEEDEADLFFMIAAPEGEENLHLQTLAKLSRHLVSADFRERLKTAKTVDEVLSVIFEIDD